MVMKMPIKARRCNIAHGKYSTVLVLPASLVKGKNSTMSGDRILLVDPKGVISEDELLEFWETCVEPQFWQWLQRRKEATQHE